MTSRLVERVQSRPRPPDPQFVKLLLKRLDVRHEQLADDLGVHRVTVTRWLNGQRRPRGPMAERYASLIEELQRVAS